MAEQLLKSSKKTSKDNEIKKISSSPKDQHPRSEKQQRKSENPVRIPQCPGYSIHLKYSDLRICKNSACQATLSANDTFCKRCSCCICHYFDDNKDPTLWLECTSESGSEEACGLSCHIECALQHGKVGVSNLGPLMQLDGSYCCVSCGRVSGILGCWKKQLHIAMDACHVGVLCYRIFLSYRLLEGTSSYNKLHEFVKDAKAKLETELGPICGVSAKIHRGAVSGLSVAVDVHRLCTLAVQNADEFMIPKSTVTINLNEGSFPDACRFLFEEVTSSSFVVQLIELSTSCNDDIKGYKLWFCKTKEVDYCEEPACVFPRDQRRIWISNLQPLTEYSIRIISYTGNGDFGQSEVTCLTKSNKVNHKNYSSVAGSSQKENSHNGASSSSTQPRTPIDIESDSGFKIRDLGKILRLAVAYEKGYFDSSCADLEKWFSANDVWLESRESRLQPVTLSLDLNVASVPDLNEELSPVESSRDEGNECTFEQAVEAGGDAFSQQVLRKPGEALAADSRLVASPKRKPIADGEMHDSDSTLSDESRWLDENFEYCVKIIRWMECEGYINKDFRLKLLTWFSLRSTKQERRVVNTFIETLIDDPSSLAGQLIDSFSDTISIKRPRNGFCNKFWH